MHKKVMKNTEKVFSVLKRFSEFVFKLLVIYRSPSNSITYFTEKSLLIQSIFLETVSRKRVVHSIDVSFHLEWVFL